MDAFLNSLRKEGYSENTIETYRRILKRFFRFLEIYGCDEHALDAEILLSYFRASYGSDRSVKTALSVVRQYLLFKGIRMPRFKMSSLQEEMNFRLVSEEEWKVLENRVSSHKSSDMRLALLIMFKLGMKPSDIVRLSRYSLKFIGSACTVEVGKTKRLLIYRDLKEKIIRKINSSDAERLLAVKYGSLKISGFRALKKCSLRLSDLRDNYAYELLKMGMPLEIVVEYSGLSLGRVSYLHRFHTLRSSIDIIESKFKEF